MQVRCAVDATLSRLRRHPYLLTSIRLPGSTHNSDNFDRKSHGDLCRICFTRLTHDQAQLELAHPNLGLPWHIERKSSGLSSFVLKINGIDCKENNVALTKR